MCWFWMRVNIKSHLNEFNLSECIQILLAFKVIENNRIINSIEFPNTEMNN